MSKEIKTAELMESLGKFLKQCDQVEAEFKSYSNEQKTTSATETVEQRFARKKEQSIPANTPTKRLSLHK